MKVKVLLSLDEKVHKRFKRIAGHRYVSTMVENFMKRVIAENEITRPREAKKQK